MFVARLDSIGIFSHTVAMPISYMENAPVVWLHCSSDYQVAFSCSSRQTYSFNYPHPSAFSSHDNQSNL